jgi:hypothetical protein
MTIDLPAGMLGDHQKALVEPINGEHQYQFFNRAIPEMMKVHGKTQSSAVRYCNDVWSRAWVGNGLGERIKTHMPATSTEYVRWFQIHGFPQDVADKAMEHIKANPPPWFSTDWRY